MLVDETVGVLAYSGGLVVDRPELSVGVVRAVSRVTGLELELLARRPLDRRSAIERQADIRARRGAATPAPRRLLPEFDEGEELRVGWLDRDGRARWEFGSWSSSSSGDHFEGTRGPSLHTGLRFPPLFDTVSVVLAWPEIGFGETVVELPLPDRATVERGNLSIWEAPVAGRPAPAPLTHRAGIVPFDDDPAVETGRILAGPQVLSRGQDAVVVLNRLTAVDDALSLEILSVARIAVGSGANVAVVQGREVLGLRPGDGSAEGGDGEFHSTAEFFLPRPAGDGLTLLVTWPEAGLPDVSVQLPGVGRPA